MSERGPERRRFDIQSCIGAGSFGEVYLATMRDTGGLRTEVAVKVLKSDLEPASQAVQRLRDEARFLGLLNHPSILKIHGLVMFEERVSLISEYVNGADLSDCLLGDDRLPLSAVLEILSKVADALDTAHSSPGDDGQPLCLEHRDIKPANIRIGRHGEVKVLDFGIATATGVEREAQTSTDIVVGTSEYMAPERFADGVESIASDVYSMGCVLYEAMAGKRLFGQLVTRKRYALTLLIETHDAHINDRLDALPPGSEQAVALLRQMVAYEPVERPKMSELSTQLEELAEEIGGPNLRRWCRKRVWAPVTSMDGPLVGRTITEAGISQAIARSRNPAPKRLRTGEQPVLRARSKPRWGLRIAIALGLLLLIGGVGTFSLVSLGLVGAAGWSLSAQDIPDGSPAQAQSAPGKPNPTSKPGAKPAPKTSSKRRAGTPAGAPDPTTDADDGVADVDDGAASPAADCGDLISLEPQAILGRLESDSRSCLAGEMRNSSLDQTERAKIGKLLLVDAQVRCDGGDCTDYEREQVYYFAEVERSSADLLFAWATYLHDSRGTASPDWNEVVLWSDRSLDRKSEWTGVSRLKKVDKLLEICARQTFDAYTSSPKDEDLRIKARNRSIDWLIYRVQIDKDSTIPLQMCASAGGSYELCMERAPDPKGSAAITFVSAPVGATLTVDGKPVDKKAPAEVTLDYGPHTVTMTLGEVTSEQVISVASDMPTRWMWRSKGDSWTGSL